MKSSSFSSYHENSPDASVGVVAGGGGGGGGINSRYYVHYDEVIIHNAHISIATDIVSLSLTLPVKISFISVYL